MQKPISIFRSLVVAGLVAASAACASHRTYEQSSGGDVQLSDVIPVQIVNDNYADMNVYAMIQGVPHRLGTVTGNSKATFSIRASQVPTGEVRLIGDAIGGAGAASSGTLAVGPGSTIIFNIAPALSQSTGSVR